MGRLEIVTKDQLVENVEKLPTMAIEGKSVRCLRCNTVHDPLAVQLASGSYYCPACIQLGRVASHDYFVTETAPLPQARRVTFSWTGQLSPAQALGAQQVEKCMRKNQELLLWAVTGSGKTEMLFAGIHQALAAGKRVGIASPRIDVCHELHPRFQAVFPEEEILLLYGGSESYRYTPLTICTTHQLLRFYRAFDVLVIDEIDAFPYANAPELKFATQNARKEMSSLIYLSATPDQKLLHEIADFHIHKVPARYHRRPLPQPRLLWWNRWRQKCKNGQLRLLMKEILRLVEKNHVLLFCPSIPLMEKLYQQLQKKLPTLRIGRVYAESEDREEQVQTMRQQEVDLLLTTTILERGVTFERLSVIILGANHRVFNQAALVQIAGRVDRKGGYTGGEVIYIYDEMTSSIKQACRQIREMNQLARKAGLLDEM